MTYLRRFAHLLLTRAFRFASQEQLILPGLVLGIFSIWQAALGNFKIGSISEICRWIVPYIAVFLIVWSLVVYRAAKEMQNDTTTKGEPLRSPILTASGYPAASRSKPSQYLATIIGIASVLPVLGILCLSIIEALLFVARLPPYVQRPPGHQAQSIENPPSNIYKVPARPDVTLRFVYPEDPALVIVNGPKSVARDIKWNVTLWNAELPDRNDPLPIPFTTFDWLKPGGAGGPQDLFDQAPVSPLLKQGDRLYGYASVDCPTCVGARSYFIYIIYGKNGWFSEVPKNAPLRPTNFSRPIREYYLQYISKTPLSRRTPIRAD